MIRLDSTLRKLQIVLGGAVTTNQLPVIVSYSDKTATAYTGGTQRSASNNTTQVDICSAPAASTVRDVDNMTVYNKDTVSATVTILYDDNGTDAEIAKAVLLTGDQLVYTHGSGWRVLDASGSIKTANTSPTTSAVLAAQITDETGTAGALVFNNTPTLNTPVLANPSFSGTTANMGTVTTIDINGGTADGVVIGGASPAAGTFTTITATGNVVCGDATTDTLTSKGQLLCAAGTVSLPGITREGDVDTGLYFPAANILAVTLAGVEISRWVGNDGMSLGSVSASAIAARLKIIRGRDDLGSGAGVGNIDFAAGTAETVTSRILGLVSGTSEDAGDITISTAVAGTLGEVVRFKTGGNVLIGTTTNGTDKLQINGSTAQAGTVVTAGTTGNQTINKPCGRVNIAAAGTTITVTNNLVTASTLVFAVAATNDTTAIVKNVVPGAGSFVINMNAAVTAETAVAWHIINVI